MKKLKFNVMLLIFCISLTTITYAEESTYINNQLLIRFKEGINPQDVLKILNINYKEIKRLHTIVPIINKVKKDLKLEKNNLSDEELFKTAYKEMSEVEKSTYRNYVVIFPKGSDIEEITIKLKKSPDIETVEKNLVVKIQKP